MAPACQGMPGMLGVVERRQDPRSLLIGLVALSGKQDYVAGPRLPDRRRDRVAAIEFDRVTSIPRIAYPVDDVARNRFGILAAWIVAGDDYTVGQPRRDSAHLRALAAVTIAAASEHA